MTKAVIKLKPFNIGKVTELDLAFGMLDLLGCSISSMPRGLKSIAYTNNWEYFDPEKVINPENLPDHWKIVYDLHMRPDMKDCRDLHYKYVHVPVEILAEYPRVPVRGIFCLATNTEKKPNEIQAEDLIWIGNEFD